jgi:hypothetical protein
MYERSYGYQYEQGGKLDTAAIAKLIRRDIKTAVGEGLLPDRWAYSVKTDRFAGGSSIDVRVTNCADAWMPCPGYQVGTRRDHGDGCWTATGCGDPWCKAGGEHKDLPDAQYHDVLTEEALAAKMTLERIHGAYNHDGSDAMTDYFDVNYYGHVAFQDVRSAQWEAEEKARKAAKRDALAAATETCRIKVYGKQRRTVHTAAKVDGKWRLACGAQLWRSSLYSKTEEDVTCSRCMKRGKV